jgi:hypothetical protein
MLTALRRRLAGVAQEDSVAALACRVDELSVLVGSGLARDVRAAGTLAALEDAEFKVFSQFGDDGIIQYLLGAVGIEPHERSFVEFGVEDYREANTRFLLLHDNWRGLVMDGNEAHVRRIAGDRIAWRHELTAVHAFLDRDNVGELIRRHGFWDDLGLLSIDVDGNDYWIWESLDGLRPPIVVVEYNSVLGAERAVTVPYDPAFARATAHPSYLYWGASLAALALLAERKGYALVGSNRAGNNAYFVSADRLGSLRRLTPAEAYVESRFRESRGPRGELTLLSGAERLEAIADLPLYDVETGETIVARELAPTQQEVAR